MKRRILSLTLVLVLLTIGAASLSGCTSCSRQEMSSSMAPSTLPPVSSLPPAVSEPDFDISEPDVSLPEVSVPTTAPAMSADFAQIGALSKDAVKWGPGVQQDDQGRSIACVGLQEKYGCYNADFIGPNTNRITLTFDQGYENGFTASILDTLKEKDVQGVFFITGHYARTNPDLIQRMIDEGHIVGSHSNNHLNFAECPIEEAYEDVKSLHDYVRETFNYDMFLFRFPEGAFNEQSLALLQQMGYHSVFWSFGYQDWDPKNQMGADKAMEKITKFLHPGEIMLLHTVGADNAALLGDLIDTIRDRGFEIGMYEFQQA